MDAEVAAVVGPDGAGQTMSLVGWPHATGFVTRTGMVEAADNTEREDQADREACPEGMFRRESPVLSSVLATGLATGLAQQPRRAPEQRASML